MTSPLSHHSVLYLWITLFCVGDPAFTDVIHLGNSRMNFYNADDYCERYGGKLLSVHSDEQQEAAVNVCTTAYHSDHEYSGCWIGLHQPDSVLWNWTDGSQFDYGITFKTYPWLPSEPNNMEGATCIEDCVQIWANRSYGWNDKCCTTNENYPLCGMRYVNCLCSFCTFTKQNGSNQRCHPHSQRRIQLQGPQAPPILHPMHHHAVHQLIQPAIQHHFQRQSPPQNQRNIHQQGLRLQYPRLHLLLSLLPPRQINQPKIPYSRI